MHQIANWLSITSSYVWGIPLIVLLLGTHLFLTFRLRFIQRHLWTAITIGFSNDKHSPGDISQFSALMTALAATIGTGNIIGVATAVSIGGPGAVFWLWITGVFGIATKYSEALLAVKYRVVTEDETMAGGPMYVLEKALNLKFLAVIFSVLTAIAAFGIGCSVQSNSIAVLMKETFNVNPQITGIVLAITTAFVILGGIKTIAKFCNALVPFMAIFYIVGCTIILIAGYATLPSTIVLIITSAFTGQAMTGGFVGASWLMAMRYGVARGLFSNESGMGSAPIVAAAARTKNPVRQALVSSSGTFWDTVVVCLMTGLVLVNSGMWNDGLSTTLMTNAAFTFPPKIGPMILTIGLLTFVFSTIIGWSYYGEKCIEYLGGKKTIFAYRVLWCIMVYVGSVFSMKAVWDAADIANGLMAIPNLISLLLLSGVIVKETKHYLWENRLDEAEVR
ncbi:MAG: sodium:alanine symporter family protein [Candidatus Margulisiibacteriota bacterium]